MQPIKTIADVFGGHRDPAGDASFPQNAPDASPNPDSSSQTIETGQLKTAQIIFRPSGTCATPPPNREAAIGKTTLNRRLPISALLRNQQKQRSLKVVMDK